MIIWKKVLQCFEGSDYKIVNTVDLYQEYWYKKTLYKGMIANDPTVLYVIHSDHLSTVTFENNVAVIVIKGEEPIANTELKKIRGNAILLDEPKETSKGISHLDTIFQNQSKVSYVMQKLLEIVANDGGIQKIVEMVSAFFKEPIALLDTTFRFIARSQTYKPISGKSVFSDDVHYGDGYNKTMLEYFKKIGLLEKIMHSTSPFSFYVKEEENAYFMPVLVNQIKVAYLIIYSNKLVNRLEEYYLEYLPLFAQMISIELAKRNFYLFNKGTYYNYIFSLILSDKKVDVDDVKMRLHIYGYDLRENMYLLEIEAYQDEIKAMHQDKIAEACRHLFRNSIYVFNDDHVFFLISRDKNDLPSTDEIEEWNLSLESQGLVGSMTGPFYDFSEIHQHMKEVRMVLDAVLETKIKRNLFMFKEYQMKSMISCLKREDIRLFLYQPVLDLIAYDNLHGTELVQTLKVFLEYPKEIGFICERLCIHKNTLYKRLDRIETIMNCDYRNGNEIMKILLTLEMLDK